MTQNSGNGNSRKPAKKAAAKKTAKKATARKRTTRKTTPKNPPVTRVITGHGGRVRLLTHQVNLRLPIDAVNIIEREQDKAAYEGRRLTQADVVANALRAHYGEYDESEQQ